MPSGKPKTIAVPVKFLSASRKVRIVTNLCVYWDEIFLSEEAWRADSETAPKLRWYRPILASAVFRNHASIRAQAARYLYYGNVSPTSYWNPTPGFIHATGMSRTAERCGRPADRYGFRRRTEAAFSRGCVSGVAGGMDAGFSAEGRRLGEGLAIRIPPIPSVEPLPFHGMSVYPYPPDEQYPRDAFHDRYQRLYNTRPAQVLLPPFEPRQVRPAHLAMATERLVCSVPGVKFASKFPKKIAEHCDVGYTRTRRWGIRLAARLGLLGFKFGE